MILILTDTAQDYAADYLTHGFVQLLGGDAVVDYPRKASLHTSEVTMDCDLNLPTRQMTSEQVLQALRDRAFDLIVIPSVRGNIPGILRALHRGLALNRDRIVFVDGEDDAANRVPWITAILTAPPVQSFKRELPLGEHWSAPLPFGYPEERIVPVNDSSDRAGAIYAVEIWPWARGQLRERLGHLLQSQPWCTVRLTYDGLARTSVSEYHAANRRALVAISPAGAGYHTNRHLDVIADGCCPVLERPWRAWPAAPTEMLEVRFFSGAVDAADIAQELVHEPTQALEIARSAQTWLRKCATTTVRARTVWESVHRGEGGQTA